MASASLLHLSTIIYVIFVSFQKSSGCFTSIISFGDSLTDTGNYLLSSAEPVNVGRLPYGETYFHRPTGRSCDGRIILDFIAEAMGLPYVPPFLGGSSGRDFPSGVNFAVAGVTAIESGFFWEKGITLSSNYSLDVQIKWFRQLLPSLCDDNAKGEFLNKSLFFVGEIGGNDYNGPLSQGRGLEETRTYVPRVIDAIGSTIDQLIDLGARTLVVPSYLPMGCLPQFLTLYQTSRKEDYEPQTGCLKPLNEFVEYHDRMLLRELARVRERHPSATVIYANYYDAAMRIFQDHRHFGFGEGYLSACCGGGGPYGYNGSVECGSEGASVCRDPSKFISWDGVHFTEAAYRAIAGQLVHGPFAISAIDDSCHARRIG